MDISFFLFRKRYCSMTVTQSIRIANPESKQKTEILISTSVSIFSSFFSFFFSISVFILFFFFFNDCINVFISNDIVIIDIIDIIVISFG